MIQFQRSGNAQVTTTFKIHLQSNSLFSNIINCGSSLANGRIWMNIILTFTDGGRTASIISWPGNYDR